MSNITTNNKTCSSPITGIPSTYDLCKATVADLRDKLKDGKVNQVSNQVASSLGWIDAEMLNWELIRELYKELQDDCVAILEASNKQSIKLNMKKKQKNYMYCADHDPADGVKIFPEDYVVCPLCSGELRETSKKAIIAELEEEAVEDLDYVKESVAECLKWAEEEVGKWKKIRKMYRKLNESFNPESVKVEGEEQPC